MKRKQRRTYIHILLMFSSLWMGVNILFLSRFPFVHTDEVWLASLSRTMLEKGSPAVTESFFNILPRTPHALRILYHILQIPLLSIAGFNIFGARLLSLVFGVLCLLMFYRILEKWKRNALAGTLFLSVQIQFLYASHFGRQEILILFMLLLSLNFLFSESLEGAWRGFWAGLPIAVAIGIHPNAFIAAWPAGLILIFCVLSKKRRPRELGGFLLPLVAGAVFFTGLSLFFNGDFIRDYGMRGTEAGFFEPLDVKVLGLDDFYRKLFFRLSGTYYTPEIRPVFIMAAAAILVILSKKLVTSFKKDEGEKAVFLNSEPFGVSAFALISMAGVNAGLILIGKYSPPSILFLMPFLVILILTGVESLKGWFRYGFYALVFAVFVGNSWMMIYEEMKYGGEPHALFEESIARSIPSDAVTLGELTAGFCFDEGKFLDWRNLAMLRPLGMSFESYVKSSGIEYIVVSDDIEHIYRSRPVWNILYGNPGGYYRELEAFLSEDCELVAEFESPGYGSRLVFRRGKFPWKLRVYHLKSTRRAVVQD